MAPVKLQQCYWYKYEDAHAVGSNDGITATGGLNACLDRCRSFPGCLAVDYTESDKSCWVHTVAADLEEVETDVGQDLYVLKAGSCENCEYFPAYIISHCTPH